MDQKRVGSMQAERRLGKWGGGSEKGSVGLLNLRGIGRVVSFGAAICKHSVLLGLNFFHFASEKPSPDLVSSESTPY